MIRTFVFFMCDEPRCASFHRYNFRGTAGPEEYDLARADAINRGWRLEDGRTLCPACVAVADVEPITEAST